MRSTGLSLPLQLVFPAKNIQNSLLWIKIDRDNNSTYFERRRKIMPMMPDG
jgi:hypothetical protein